jgi:hypothetical protein
MRVFRYVFGADENADIADLRQAMGSHEPKSLRFPFGD